jgi:hypothetical protein
MYSINQKPEKKKAASDFEAAFFHSLWILTSDLPVFYL